MVVDAPGARLPGPADEGGEVDDNGRRGRDLHRLRASGRRSRIARGTTPAGSRPRSTHGAPAAFTTATGGEDEETGEEEMGAEEVEEIGER